MEDLRKYINLVEEYENGTLYHLSKRVDIDYFTSRELVDRISRSTSFVI